MKDDYQKVICRHEFVCGLTNNLAAVRSVTITLFFERAFMKHYFNYLVILALLQFTHFDLHAQDKAYLQHVEKFFELVKGKKYGESIDYIYSSNSWILKTKSDDISLVRSSFASLPQLMGGYSGFEKLAEEEIGTRYVHLEYIVFFERQPLRIYFSFYKPEKEWIIQTFGYQDNIDEWSTEKARNTYLYSSP
ncbi:MAG: hypothetical protein ABTQ25_00770 [Nitrosomonas ureae]